MLTLLHPTPTSPCWALRQAGQVKQLFQYIHTFCTVTIQAIALKLLLSLPAETWLLNNTERLSSRMCCNT